MLRTVDHRRPDPFAAMAPATPLDRICVVETGKPYSGSPEGRKVRRRESAKKAMNYSASQSQLDCDAL